MTTAQDLINKSAKQAGILAQGQALEGGINSDALDILNLMIARFQNDGIFLGIDELEAADELFIDRADEEALKLSLTMRLVVEHKRPIQPGLSVSTKTAVTELQAKYAVIPVMSLDAALTRKYLPRKRTFDTTE